MASGDEWTQVVKSKHKRTQVRPTPTLSPIRTTEQNIPLQSIRNRPILKQTPPEDSSRGYRSHERSSLPPGRYTYIERREYNVSTYKSGAWESEQYFERRTDLPSGRENQKLSLAETRFTKRPGVIVLPQKPNKPKKSKRKKTDSRYLRSVNEVSLSLSDVLREVPKNKDTNRTRISTGVSIVSTRSRTLINTNSKITPRNVLDSTAPLVRRGKERITPKNKKPTKLKRLVLEERRLIKLQKELKKNPNSEDTKQLEEEERHQTLPEIRISFIDSDLNEHEAECTDTLSDPIESGETGEQKNDVINEDKPLSENENSSVKEEVISKPETAKIEIEPFEVSFLGEGLPGLHTKKFREYCYQMPDKKVDELTNKLLYELMKLQARQHDTNKMKAKGKKRLVFGFHEVSKHLRVEHLKCIVIARDLERSRAVGGLEHQITTICSQCSTQSVQVIFALTKHTLSFSVCKPKTIVSIVGILNYEGRQEIYKELVKLVIVKQDEYFEIVEEKKNKVQTVHKEDTGLKIKQETSEYVEPDTPNNSNTNSSNSFSNTDSVTHEKEPLRLKRFEPKDVETTNEFIPNSFISHNYPYPGIYASQYIQHYNYPHYQALYSQYYYYPAAYSHTTQYSRYNQ